MDLILKMTLFLMLAGLNGVHGSGISHDAKDESMTVIGKPQNVIVSCLNLNYTLHWQPPPVSSVNDVTIYYTVRYFRPWPHMWLDVPSCSNITTNECNLITVFNSYSDIYLDLQVNVHAYDKYGNTGMPVNIIFNPLTNALVGAPSVRLASVTSNDASINITPPVTPFENILVTQYLTEAAIKYNMSILEVVGHQQFIKLKEKISSSSVDTVYFSNLHPDTLYRLDVQTFYDSISGKKYSPDVAVVFFKTNQKRPGYGSVVSQAISEPDCTKPDLRNVSVSWQAPPQKFQNGNITAYTIICKEKGSSFRTSDHVKDASVKTFTLFNLSRWQSYEVSVIAHNTGGSTSSGTLTITRHTPDIRSSQPQNLHVSSPSGSRDKSLLVSWQAPLQYTECIFSYNLKYQWELEEGRQTRQIAALNTTAYQLEDLQSSSYKYTMQVVPNIHSGYNTDTAGVPAITTYPQTDYKGGLLITWQPILVIAVIVMVILISIWGYLCKRRTVQKILGSQQFNLDCDNKILKFAQSYTLPAIPQKRVEPEYFDAILSTNELQQLCTSVNDTDSNAGSTCSSHSLCSRESNVFGKFYTKHERKHQDSHEPPIITPDNESSCYLFPKLSKKILGKDEQNQKKDLSLLQYPTAEYDLSTDVCYNHYLTVGLPAIELSDKHLTSTDETDLEMESNQVQIDTATETCELLQDQKQTEMTNTTPYCKMSQLPSLGLVNFPKLKSYLDTDKQSYSKTNVVVASNKLENETASECKYPNNAMDSTVSPLTIPYENRQNASKPLEKTCNSSEDALKASQLISKNHVPQQKKGALTIGAKAPRPIINRADSYPYSKLADLVIVAEK